MQALNVWRMSKVAVSAALALALAACGGGAPTRQLAEQATDSPTSNPTGSTNVAPVISGTPGASLQAGQTYSFQPTASDANGDALSFAVSNLPVWASFNSSTGRLTGTPGTSAVGSYGAITITVSDGKAAASLPAFQIVVTAAASVDDPPPQAQRPPPQEPVPTWPGGVGSATLNWEPPTTNVDGSALTDLAGYQIHFGLNEDTFGYVVTIDNPSVSSYIVEQLPAGAWYFAVVAVNKAGYPSPLSSVKLKRIS